MNILVGDPASPSAPRLTLGVEHRNPVLGLPVALELAIEAPLPVGGRPARRPLSIGLVIDRSGSMAGPKLAAAVEAAARLVDALDDGDRVALVAFDTEVADVAPSTALDDPARADLRRRLEEVSPGATTALFDGFARGAQLVAEGTPSEGADSWVIVLSDGMGNHGLTDPDEMRSHAAALAERGIRTITIGIGDDYQAAQLTALATGGAGEFHHASVPSEICEIVLGELKAIRTATLQDLRIAVSVRGATNWLLLGGHATQEGARGTSRFDRVDGGRTARVVVLGWPQGAYPEVEAEVTWRDEHGRPASATARASTGDGPAARDLALASRAARLWHAHLTGRALELNEQHRYDEADRLLRDAVRDLHRYVAGLPGLEDLPRSLDRLRLRAGRAWETVGHKEAYVLARKFMHGKLDLRGCVPQSLDEAMDRDELS